MAWDVTIPNTYGGIRWTITLRDGQKSMEELKVIIEVKSKVTAVF